ncbi:hypothetical protein FQR65_LT11088 [Abscondita terminalis]|nr:hypothetical protein FQR65_LT11088 [Abscondita terminalis]
MGSETVMSMQLPNNEEIFSAIENAKTIAIQEMKSFDISTINANCLLKKVISSNNDNSDDSAGSSDESASEFVGTSVSTSGCNDSLEDSQDSRLDDNISTTRMHSAEKNEIPTEQFFGNEQEDLELVQDLTRLQCIGDNLFLKDYSCKHLKLTENSPFAVVTDQQNKEYVVENPQYV